MAGVKGRSGGKPKPRALKELAGTFRADRHNPNEPGLPALESAPRCPRHLKGMAQKSWREVAKLLTAMGVLSEADLPALEVLCSIYAQWYEAEAKLIEYGMMLSNAGNIYPSPYVQIARNSAKELRTWLGEFGLTPASRSRVSVAKVQIQRSPLDDDSRDWFGDHRN